MLKYNVTYEEYVGAVTFYCPYVPLRTGGTMTDPKPLTFDDEKKEVPSSVGQPVAFSFDAIAIGSNCVAIGPLQFNSPPLPTPVVRPLQFPDEPQAPNVRVTAKYGNANISFKDDIKPIGSPLFADTTSPLFAKAMENLNMLQIDKAIAERVERQVRQLMNLDVDQIMNWGAPALRDEVEATQTISRIVTQVAELRGNEMIDAITDDVDGKSTFFERVTKKVADIRQIRRNLSKLKVDLQPYLKTQHIKDTLEKSDERLNVFVLSLKVVEEAAKSIGSYDSVEDIMYNRRVLLVQALQQAQLSKIQMQQTEKLIQTQLHNIEQLEMITIPAYEANQALKKRGL